MGVVLIILGVLGFGAIVIAAYVFTVAARNYVSEDGDIPDSLQATSRNSTFIMRNANERRKGVPAKFPMTVNGVTIPRERRELPDRRAVA